MKLNMNRRIIKLLLEYKTHEQVWSVPGMKGCLVNEASICECVSDELPYSASHTLTAKFIGHLQIREEIQ